MAGQIIQRGASTFLVRVYAGLNGGKRKYINKTVHGRRKDAQAVLNRLLLDRDMGQLTIPTKITLGEYLEKWQRGLTSVSPRTKQGYADALRRYILPELGGRRLTALTHWDVQRTYAAHLERGLSPRTIRHTNAVLTSALKAAVKRGELARNPASLVDLPAAVKTPRDGLTVEQVTAFLEAAADSPYKALYHLLVTTGMRPGEAFGLTWPDVDLVTCSLLVRQAVTYGAGKTPIISTPKTKRPRRIAFTRELADILSEHMTTTRDIVGSLDLVFPTIDGGLQHPNHWSKRDFKGTLRRAGLPASTRLYDLRHTMATQALRNGVPVHIVSARLGHASAKMTLDTYAHAVVGDQDIAAEALASLFYRRPTQAADAPVN